MFHVKHAFDKFFETAESQSISDHNNSFTKKMTAPKRGPFSVLQLRKLSITF